jgi:hypothetical protein
LQGGGTFAYRRSIPVSSSFSVRRRAALACASWAICAGTASKAGADDGEEVGQSSTDSTSSVSDAEFDAASEEYDPNSFSIFDRASLSAQWFWARDKIMTGLELSLGYRFVQLDLEASFVGLTEHADVIDASLLGNQLGAFLMFTPMDERYYDVSAGLGGDFYVLWGIHSEAFEAALAPRLQVRVWPLPHLGLTFNARVYLFSSDGLALGTDSSGDAGLPLLVSTGLSWSFL